MNWEAFFNVLVELMIVHCSHYVLLCVIIYIYIYIHDDDTYIYIYIIIYTHMIYIYIYYDCFIVIVLIYVVIPLHIGDDPHIFAFFFNNFEAQPAR